MASRSQGILEADVLIYVFDASKAVIDYRLKQLRVDLAKAAESLASNPIRIGEQLQLAPGNYAVKVLVKVSKSGEVGFARAEFSVPATPSGE